MTALVVDGEDHSFPQAKRKREQDVKQVLAEGEVVETKEERKRRRKEEKRAAAAAAAAAAAEEEEGSVLSEEKKSKKKKKDQKKREEVVEDDAMAMEVVSLEDQDLDEVKKSKKKKKKDKKGSKAAIVEDEEEEGIMEEIEASTVEEGEKKKKKKKKNKDKKEEESLEQEMGDMAKDSTTFTARSQEGNELCKDFYVEHPETKKMSVEAVQSFWNEHEILLSGEGSERFKPVMEFSHAGFSKPLLACLNKGFSKPTPIQSQCWPVLSSGIDIIAIAETGSGKTLGFSMPGLSHVLGNLHYTTNNKKNKNTGPRMLVVAPTRELAMQSAEVMEPMCQDLGLKATCIYGGVPKHDQRAALRAGVHVVVATPGRLNDLIEEGECDLSAVTYLVLDEADRMLDAGFEEAIRAIISQTNPNRQTALFSATWPTSIQKLASEFLTSPIKVTIGGEDLSSNKRVTQVVEVLDERERDQRLRRILQQYHGSRSNRVLLFALYKKEAARLERSLQQQGWNCISIHGDKSQADRNKAVASFKSKSIPLLIATDVAARGLDIPDVDCVINYSFPLTIEDYIHRIGRTGRAGKTGTAHTFFHQGDKGLAGALVNVLRQAEQTVPSELQKFGCHVKKKEHKLYGAFAKDVDMTKKATKIVFAASDDEEDS